MKKTFTKYISGLILLLASAFLINVAIFSPASAASYNDTSNRQQKLKMFLYAELVRACYAANDKVETDNERVDNGQLFYTYGTDARPIVYAVNPQILQEVPGFGEDDYWTGCGHNDGELTKAALRSWGISAIDLVCEMGYQRDSAGASCRDSTTIDYKSWGGIDGGQNRTDRFVAALNKLTGLDVNNPGNDILYMKWASVVIDSCTTGQGLPENEATVRSPLRYELYEAGETGSRITKVYSGGNKTTETPHLLPLNYTCGQALNRANGYINDYLSKTQEVAALKLCEQQGYRNIPGGSFPDQRDLTACVRGTQNKEDTSYCERNFADISYQGARISKQSERDACKWGQGQTVNVSEVLSEEAAAADGSAGEGTSCAIEAIGWIICPVVNFLSFIADSSFDFLSDTFLRTDPQAFNTESTTYRAWQQIRNVANVVFVIGFIIIIFSQLTGMGVSNYGVKKTLPRLIIAAVLVNVSFFITQIAIDLSNILGYSIRDVFDAMAKGSGIGTAQNVTSDFTTGEGFAGIAGLILTGAVGVAAIYAMLSAFLPILIAAVIALAMILFILVARQALIILLVVISPLAFVALLLPNTERLFTMWRKLLTAMLLLFPIVALIFGASLLASQVLSSSFSGHVEGDGSNMFGQIIAAAVLVIPLFAVPVVLKKSLDAVPMLGGLANKWSSRANSRIGSKAKESYARSLWGRGRAIRKQAKENYRSKRFARRITDGDRKGLGMIDQKLSGAIAGGMPPVTKTGKHARQEVSRVAVQAAEKADIEDAQAAAVNLDRLKIDQNEARIIASGGKVKGIDGGSDFASRSAAIQRIVASNDVRGMNDLWDESKNWTGAEGDKLRNVFAKSLEGSSYRPAYYGAGAIAGLKLNQHGSAKETVASAVQAGAYSPEKIARADKDELQEVQSVIHTKTDATSKDYDANYLQTHQRFINDAHKALTDRELSLTLGKNRENIEKIRVNANLKPVDSPESSRTSTTQTQANPTQQNTAQQAPPAPAQTPPASSRPASASQPQQQTPPAEPPTRPKTPPPNSPTNPSAGPSTGPTTPPSGPPTGPQPGPGPSTPPSSPPGQ